MRKTMEQLLLELYNTSMRIRESVAEKGEELTEQDKSIIKDAIDTLLHAVND